MNRNESRHRRDVHRPSFARRGAMLVMALFFIVLATALAVLIMANTSQLVRTTRQAHEEIVLRQLIESGRAWASLHGPAITDHPTTLNANALAPQSLSAEVTITTDPNTPEVLLVIARVRFPAHDAYRTARFPLSR